MSSKNECEISENTLPIIKKITTDRVIDLIAKLKGLKSSAINASQFIVFKVSEELNDHLINDKKDCEQVYNRSNGKDVYTLVFDLDDGKYRFYKIGKNEGILQNSDELQRTVRQSDLVEVLEQTKGGCIHNPPKNTHFKTPSGLHTKAFLRLADAIHSYNALDRISFWLQSYMMHADAVLVDNWSLSPIILQAQILLKKEIPFDCLSEHVDYDIEETKRLVQKLVNRIKPGSKILIIVSVSASGSFLKNLLDLCCSFHSDYEFDTVSIYQLPSINITTDDVLCQIKNDSIEFFTESDCPYCKNDEKLYVIDRKYYYPKIDDESKIKLKSKYIEVNDNNIVRKSLDELGTVYGVFCVHRDDPNDGITPRHHAYYVDVYRLVDHSDFIGKLNITLESIAAAFECLPDVIICPPHDAGRRLAAIVSDYFNCDVVLTHDMRLNINDAAIVKDARHICILDDVLISGSRLDVYNRALREDINPRLLKRISYLIAVGRTDSKNKYHCIRDSLISKHDWSAEIYSVYQIYLPTWDEEYCPWCKEQEIWDQIDSPFSPPENYRKRIQQLGSRSSAGITDQPLARLNGIGDIQVGSSSPMAYSGSSEMVTLFNIAVALQMMRHEEDEAGRLERMLYSNNALDGGEDGNFKRFSEPLIQACLLKNVKPNEWSSDVIDSGITSLISEVHNENTHILLLEIIIFILRYSLREKIDIQTLTGALKGYLSNDDPVRELVRKIDS